MELFDRLDRLGYARMFESERLVVYLKTDTAAVRLAVYFATESWDPQEYPETFDLLHRHVPAFQSGRCVNGRNLPFYREAEHTELGHLFEHIMLEYLCLCKRQAGFSRTLFSGRTTWNWQRDPFGTFFIDIGIGAEDHPYVAEALTQSLNLLEKILENTTGTGSPILEPPARPLRAQN